jgi:DNA-binding NtrC family response regulator
MDTMLQESAQENAGFAEDGAGCDGERDVFRLALEIAPLHVDVLLEGETGSGKDMLAREIHAYSNRPGRFVAINCAAIPESLAESELFGHEAGAFTGAVRAREGKLETADKGTLYLDEIDSMPLAAQAKLLRALQERGSERLGGSRFYRADFRVIASTKVPLHLLVAKRDFRRDLYYRLNVVRLRLPPLRERPEELMPLFHQFLLNACRRHGKAVPQLGPHVRRRLAEHGWNGNVRELRNAAERFALGLDPIDADLQRACQPAEVADVSGDESVALRDRLKNYERDVILVTLKRCGGSVARAARELQVPSNTLYYRMRNVGIQAEQEE